MAVDDFVDACVPVDPRARRRHGRPERFDEGVFRAVAPLVQERVSVLGEVPAMVDFLFLEAPVDRRGRVEGGGRRTTRAPAILDGAIAAYDGVEWAAEALHGATQALAEAVGRKLGKAQAPIRVAVTGRRVGPPLFESHGGARARVPCWRRLRRGPGDDWGSEAAARPWALTRRLRLFVRLAIAAGGRARRLPRRDRGAGVADVALARTPHRAQAIVVMGAAQYNGGPSPDLAARLDEADQLWRRATRRWWW